MLEIRIQYECFIQYPFNQNPETYNELESSNKECLTHVPLCSSGLSFLKCFLRSSIFIMEITNGSPCQVNCPLNRRQIMFCLWKMTAVAMWWCCPSPAVMVPLSHKSICLAEMSQRKQIQCVSLTDNYTILLAVHWSHHSGWQTAASCFSMIYCSLLQERDHRFR